MNIIDLILYDMLSENVDINNLYHGTSFDNLLEILKSNTIKKSIHGSEEFKGVSLSVYKSVASRYGEAVIKLNAKKILSDYQSIKFDDGYLDDNGFDENGEMRILGNVFNIKHYIEEIILLKNFDILQIKAIDPRISISFSKKSEDRIIEAKQVGLLYHNTSAENLFGILMDDSLGENHNPCCFTRNKNFWFKKGVQLVLNGDKLSEHYKIKPIDYWNLLRKTDPSHYFKHNDELDDESEERVYKKIEHLSKYLISIRIKSKYPWRGNLGYSLWKRIKKTYDDFNEYGEGHLYRPTEDDKIKRNSEYDFYNRYMKDVDIPDDDKLEYIIENMFPQYAHLIKWI